MERRLEAKEIIITIPESPSFPPSSFLFSSIHYQAMIARLRNSPPPTTLADDPILAGFTVSLGVPPPSAAVL